ncbi:transmembrane ascorbate ferrireductase 1 [Neltuma alba]|uniref:transmembrane ascorbate ferrireductase 1 n=1 Tax=Neltuma alba TaxID=207710 RepID=UPI0010A458E9|nr:transmembrane ascorbate ferrireductase 1 [Prosopis alba]XP_028806233.1 transmembrane ascorbate ferrireductase 1-like [Prosopis alba]
MDVGVNPFPITFAVHFLGITAIAMVLVWTIHYLGGLAWNSPDKSLLFNVHPVLMLIGLVVIGGEAIISYKSFPLEKEVKKVIHLVLHAIALVLGIVGIYAVFLFHNEKHIANLYSFHSWIGIAAIVLYGVQWIYGFVMFMYPGGDPALRRVSLPWHILFGLLVYMMVVAAAILGFLEKMTFLEESGLAKFGSEAYLVNFTSVVTVLFAALVVFCAITKPPAPAFDDYAPI